MYRKDLMNNFIRSRNILGYFKAIYSHVFWPGVEKPCLTIDVEGNKIFHILAGTSWIYFHFGAHAAVLSRVVLTDAAYLEKCIT